MGILECASKMSKLRGLEYFKEKRVRDVVMLGEDLYSAKVAGTFSEPYTVLVNIAHPRKSKCDCPHANGRHLVCKHIVAAYLEILPKEVSRLEKFVSPDYENHWDDYDHGYDEYGDDDEDDEGVWNSLLENYVLQMKKSELQQTLLDLLHDGPKWQYDDFILEHLVK